MRKEQWNENGIFLSVPGVDSLGQKEQISWPGVLIEN